MMTIKPNWRTAAPLLLSTTLLLGHSARAEQPMIELSAADQQRLDIRFAAVRGNTAADGFQVPAQVIHSPEQRTQIKSYFQGTLAGWIVNSGAEVRSGIAIARISSPELMHLQERWLAAKHHLSDMQQQLDKDRQLLQDGVISEQRLQQTQRQHRQAAFNMQAWQQQLLQAGVTDEDLRAVLNGNLQPGDYVLRAPATGIVSRRQFGVGDTLAANQVLATITNAADLWLHASVPAPLAQHLNLGDALQILGSAAALTLTGKSQEVSSSTQLVSITARFEGTSDFLPGQQLTLILPAQQAGIHVPASAVTHTENNTYVYVRQNHGIEVRELQLLPMGSDYLATAGISDGEQLVIQGTAQLKGIQLGLGGGE